MCCDFYKNLVSVESVGMLKPEELVSEAADILIQKCDDVLDSLSNLEMSDE